MTGTPLNRVKASAAEKKVNVYPASVVTFEHSPEVYRALGVEPKQRLVVEFDRKSINGDGKMMPRPTGMSGGPLWGAYPNGLGAWSYFLSGVLIEHHKQEDAVVCSRITSVLKAIEMLEE